MFVTAMFKEVLAEAQFELTIGEEFAEYNRKSNEMDSNYVEGLLLSASEVGEYSKETMITNSEYQSSEGSDQDQEN